MITNCRSCGCDDLHVILDLGSQPIANALLSEDELSRPEARFTLAVAFCPACALLQVTADAVSGGFGPFAQQRAIELLERGWVTILASDAHNLEHRPPLLERGRRAAAEIVGEEESWRLVRDRPRQIAARHFA